MLSPGTTRCAVAPEQDRLQLQCLQRCRAALRTLQRRSSRKRAVCPELLQACGAPVNLEQSAVACSRSSHSVPSPGSPDIETLPGAVRRGPLLLEPHVAHRTCLLLVFHGNWQVSWSLVPHVAAQRQKRLPSCLAAELQHRRRRISSGADARPAMTGPFINSFATVPVVNTATRNSV